MARKTVDSLKNSEEDSGDGSIQKKHGVKKGKKKRVRSFFLFIFSFIFSLVVFLGFFHQSGVIGEKMDFFLGRLLGWGKWLLPFLTLKLGWDLLLLKEKKRKNSLDSEKDWEKEQERKEESYYLELVGAILIIFFLASLLHLFTDDVEEMTDWAKQSLGGGYLGFGMAFWLKKYLGEIAAILLSLSLTLVGLALFFDLSFSIFKGKILIFFQLIKKVFLFLKEKIFFLFNKRKEKTKNMENDIDTDEENGVDTESESFIREKFTENENIKNLRFEDEFGEIQDELEKKEGQKNWETKQVVSSEIIKNKMPKKIHWKTPPLVLLSKEKNRILPKKLEVNVQKIKETLHHFGIEVESAGYNYGPTVVQYAFKPAIGVKLSKILAYQSNLALSLEAHSLRIEAPIPGKSLIGVEIPLDAKERADVFLRDALESKDFKNRKSKKLTIILGKDVSGELVLSDLGEMPHLMIAGATGTGKSVCINSILLSLLYQNSPEDLGLILIDPKRVELSFYRKLPHLLAPVVVETNRAVSVLKWAVEEMSRRLELLEKAGAKDIYSFNNKVLFSKEGEGKDSFQSDNFSKMPFIVIVIDEMADLMITQGKQVEKLIVRLAQLARAVGIHLIISTQKPSVEAITSLIKSNINTRIAFRVANNMDSRIILDKGGAEKLLGRGDMLFSSVESLNLRRIQGVYVSEKEVEKVVDFYSSQALNNNYIRDDGLSRSLNENIDQLSIQDDSSKEKVEDDLYERAKKVILENRRASTTFLQKELCIGYPRAAKLMDLLEKNGIVSAPSGSKVRQILIGGNDFDTDIKKVDKAQQEQETDF